MRHHAFPRPKTVLFAALLLLIAPWASAAPRQGSAQPAGISGGIAFPNVLSLAWGFVSGGWMKIGCTIEPDGRCVTIFPTKDGCHIDPSGRCVTASSAPVSPAGQGRVRRPALQTKEGCKILPDGRCAN